MLRQRRRFGRRDDPLVFESATGVILLQFEVVAPRVHADVTQSIFVCVRSRPFRDRLNIAAASEVWVSDDAMDVHRAFRTVFSPDDRVLVSDRKYASGLAAFLYLPKAVFIDLAPDEIRIETKSVFIENALLEFDSFRVQVEDQLAVSVLGGNDQHKSILDRRRAAFRAG